MANDTATANTFWVVAYDGDRLGLFAPGNPADPNFAPIELRGEIVRFEIDNFNRS
ncbi:MAG: hypothetical protein KJN73_00200 [Acidimicrobiia bacterium]|nr:hypothetical protein [Acidimicrobiia bacterium]